VLHTLNPRLHPDQVVYIADHAEDQVLFFDLTFLPLIEAVAARVKTVATSCDDRPRAHAGHQQDAPTCCATRTCSRRRTTSYDWPQFDENTASSLCYTSGTTGNPKGVLYSHRSTVLHTLAGALPDALNCSARDVILPVVPMFHVNAWGLPYVALHDRRQAGASRRRAGRQVAVRAVREREGHAVGRRAHRVAGPAGLRGGQQAEVQHHARTSSAARPARRR
jgi:acyl-CoA synthetase (AMP-forming)/AMP-acid ligase II